MPPVALLTDFGHLDPYVGILKGALLSVAPAATLVDLCHEVPPGDVETGARFLAAARPYFPPGTVFVAVVDPGVGSTRRAIALDAGGQRFVGPDNGLLVAALGATRPARVVELTERRYQRATRSRTFHGRDIFAPVAGHLVQGVPLEALGPTVRAASLVKGGGRKKPGRVVWIDRYGNVLTDVPAASLPRRFRLRAGGFSTERLQPSYAAVAPGELLAIENSYGLVEIAARDGSAARLLGLERGDRVAVEAR